MIDENDKKQIMFLIFNVLKEYSDSQHLLTQDAISKKLFNDYGIRPDRKTISVNIQRLNDCGINVEKVNNKGYYYNNPICDGELRLLIDSVLFSKSLSKEESNNLIEKIKNLGNNYFRKTVKTFCSNETIYHSKSEKLFEKIELLQKAINNERKVTFYYSTVKNEGVNQIFSAMQQIVNPYQLITSDGNYYLIGSVKFDKLCHYRVDRIRDLQITEEISDFSSQKKVRDRNLGEYLKTHPTMQEGDVIDAVLNVKKYKLEEVRDFFGGDIYIESAKAEMFSPYKNVRVKATETEIINWLLQNSNIATIVEPQEVRDKILQITKNLKDMYYCTKEDYLSEIVRDARRTKEIEIYDMQLDKGDIDYILSKTKKEGIQHSIKTIKLYSNEIEDISFLRNFPHIEKLQIIWNPVKDFSVLSELKHLNFIDIRSTYMTNLSFVKDCKNLRILSLAWNKIRDYSSIAKHEQLEYLIVCKNMQKQVEFISKENQFIKTFIAEPENINDILEKINIDIDINMTAQKEFSVFDRRERKCIQLPCNYPSNLIINIVGCENIEQAKQMMDIINSKTKKELNFVGEILKGLTVVEQKVIKCFYKDNMTIKEIAVSLGLYSDEIESIRSCALEKLSEQSCVEKFLKVFEM